MKYLPLKHGGQIPVLGLGTWQLTGTEVKEAVRIALEIGYRHIDMAEAYGNQAEIGETIAKSKVSRDELFLTSKVWWSSLSYDDVIAAAGKTLADLQVDYLDLLLIHWPNRTIKMSDTFQALSELKECGKIRNFGVSNFTIRHLEEALAINNHIVVNQVEYHPSLNQQKLKDYCDKKGIVVTAYSPICQGHDLKLMLIRELAEKYKRSAAQVIINWILAKGMVAIPRSKDRTHLLDNLKSLEWELSPDDIARIDSLGSYHRLINPPHAEFGE